VLHFCKYFANPISILNLAVSSESQWFQYHLISCPYGNTVNFSCTSQIHFCAINTSFFPFKPVGTQMPKNPQNSPFLFWHVNPHLIYECLGRPHSPRRMTDSSIASRTSAQLHNKGPIGYNGTPQIHPQNCPFPFVDHYPHLIHPSLDRLHSPSQMASGSNHPFCHSSLFGQTQTDRWARRQICNMSAYAQRVTR